MQPTVLVARKDAPASVFAVEALAGYRDAIALSVISYNRTRELIRPYGLRILFSDAFRFYPRMRDKNHEDLVVKTPAILGVHELTGFHGQSSPAVVRLGHFPIAEHGKLCVANPRPEPTLPFTMSGAPLPCG